MDPQMITILYIVGLFAILYLLIIRPQQVRQRKHQEMVRNLKLNDKVITIGGVFGTITKTKEDSLIIKVADNVRIEVLKNAISQVVETGEDE